MSNTLTVRLPEELLERLREKSRRTGLPVGRVVRQAVESSLSREEKNPLLEFAGVIKGGPRNVSSRKGFSRE
jgi:predicted DNA-binding protein